MPVQQINIIDGDASKEDLLNELAKLQKTLRYLLNGQLDFENIRAKGIVAETIDVNELSAISANLGHITAGLIEAIEMIGSIITGSLIQTKPTGQYPRIELSGLGNFFRAQSSATNSVEISSDDFGQPSLVFKDGSFYGFIRALVNDLYMGTLGGSGSIQVSSGGNLSFFASGFINVQDWSSFRNNDTGQTLQQALDSLSARISALENP